MTRLCFAAFAAAAGLAAPATADPLPAGHYDARLCVALGEAAPSCGRADAEVLRGNRVLVRISDIVYLLRLGVGRIEVVLMHGEMRIDEFVAAYAWSGGALEFVDADKRTRYELQLTAVPRLSAQIDQGSPG
jgi:hypothetical protein